MKYLIAEFSAALHIIPPMKREILAYMSNTQELKMGQSKVFEYVECLLRSANFRPHKSRDPEWKK